MKDCILQSSVSGYVVLSEDSGTSWGSHFACGEGRNGGPPVLSIT